MNKEQLIKNVAGKTGLTKKDVEIVVNGFLDVVTEALSNGEKVSLMGFGNFETRERAARKGRNPANGTEIQIEAKRVPAWKPSDKLKQLLN